jgi:Zn-dependent metalloprotease
MNHGHNPIYCILPPHMLDQIVINGTSEQRDRANQTIDQTDKMRDQRLTMMKNMAAAPAAGSGVKKRSVYSANFTSSLPGTLRRMEGAPASGDAAVDEAYDGAGYTYDLYWQVYQRDSIDGGGMELVSTVHYEQGYDNAFWNGSQMVYGDGDEDLPAAQQLFRRFTASLDVIGHELTHGVTQHTGNLNYQGQPGALNESFSDVFGVLVKQHHLQQDINAADWMIGKELLTPNVRGTGLRSMKAPGTAYDDPVLGKDPQPANMSGYVNTTSDNGGVHINSGIPNHAFYLVAMELGGFAWEKAGKIWYVTLRDKIAPGSNFQNAADLTYATAGQLYGANSLEQLAVAKGWAGVGITVSTTPTNGDTTPSSGCLSGLLKLLGGS